MKIDLIKVLNGFGNLQLVNLAPDWIYKRNELANNGLLVGKSMLIVLLNLHPEVGMQSARLLEQEDQSYIRHQVN